MNKWLFLFLALSVFFVVSACGSPETKELIDYHNGFVKNVNPKVRKIDQLMDKVSQIDIAQKAMP